MSTPLTRPEFRALRRRAKVDRASLTALDWARLSRAHADRAVRYAYCGVACASLGFVLQLAQLVLRLAR